MIKHKHWQRYIWDNESDERFIIYEKKVRRYSLFYVFTNFVVISVHFQTMREGLEGRRLNDNKVWKFGKWNKHLIYSLEEFTTLDT